MEEKSRVTIRHGMPGHDREFVVRIRGFGINNFIPQSVSDAIQRDFPEIPVLNRGSRIEVMTLDVSLADAIMASVNKVLNERPWILEMAQERGDK